MTRSTVQIVFRPPLVVHVANPEPKLIACCDPWCCR